MSSSSPPNIINQRKQALIIFSVCLLVYSVGLSCQPAGDTVPQELLPISILEQGDFYLDEYHDGQQILPYYFKYSGNRVVSAYSILPALLNVPVYAIAKSVGVDLYKHRLVLSKITAMLLAALTVVFFAFLCWRMTDDNRLALLCITIFAFGTCLWSLNSTAMWKQTTTTFLITLGLWMLMRDNRSSVALSGFFFSMAMLVRPILVVFLMVMGMYLLFHRRRCLLLYIVCALLPPMLYSAYTMTYFKGKKERFIIAKITGRDKNITLKPADMRPMMNPMIPPVPPKERNQEESEQLGNGHRKKLSTVQTMSFLERNALDAPLSKGIVGLLISPARGILTYSPLLLFGFVGALLSWVEWSRPPIFRWLSAIIFLYIIALAKYQMWWGGASFGYRLMLEMVPLLMIFFLLFWRSVHLTVIHALLIGVLLFYSVAVQLVGVYLYPSNFCYVPNDIHFNQERLWTFPDTELTRSLKKLKTW